MPPTPDPRPIGELDRPLAVLGAVFALGVGAVLALMQGVLMFTTVVGSLTNEVSPATLVGLGLLYVALGAGHLIAARAAFRGDGRARIVLVALLVVNTGLVALSLFEGRGPAGWLPVGVLLAAGGLLWTPGSREFFALRARD